LGEMKGNESDQVKVGVVYAVLAYSAWGLSTLYWKLLRGVDPSIVLGHRLVWSCLFLLLLLFWREQDRRHVLIRVRDSAMIHLRSVAMSGSCLVSHWFLYLYAIHSNRVLDASFGYYLVPLVSILLGRIVLKERLSGWQTVSVAIAFCGVVQLSVEVGTVPILGLALAISFGVYGLLRKRSVSLDPLMRSTVESMVMVVPSCGLLAGWTMCGSHANATSRAAGAAGAEGYIPLPEVILLIGGGIVTAVPLLWIANAVRRLPLSMVGFFEYLSSSIQFLIAVFVHPEPFTFAHARAFLCIWIALAIYTFGSVPSSIKKKPHE